MEKELTAKSLNELIEETKKKIKDAISNIYQSIIESEDIIYYSDSEIFDEVSKRTAKEIPEIVKEAAQYCSNEFTEEMLKRAVLDAVEEWRNEEDN